MEIVHRAVRVALHVCDTAIMPSMCAIATWRSVRAATGRLRPAGRIRDDRGSIIPLALGFFLLALLLVGGAVAYSDVFTKQRDLQAICDSAAIAAANNVDRGALHGGSSGTATVPLARADELVRAYLGRDSAGRGVAATTSVSLGGQTVEVVCRRHNRIAFGALILKSGGVDQTAYSSAQAPLIP